MGEWESDPVGGGCGLRPEDLSLGVFVVSPQVSSIQSTAGHTHISVMNKHNITESVCSMSK